jgi:ubiquinone/menaquinone biosynthesis C-methylase UbiE
MRVLSSIGIFSETEGRFSLTPLGSLLQTGPDTLKAMVLHLGEAPSWQAWGDLLHSVKTGENAFRHVHGMEVFPFYAQHPESNKIFNDAMTNYSEVVSAAIVKAYDFSSFKKVIDIGGGHGGLLTAILKENTDAKGVLFEIESAIEGAKSRLRLEGLAERCELVSGDFFESVPADGDAYILKTIIHDWDDARATTILKNIHRAMAEDGKLLLVETVIPSGNDPSFSKLGDLHMLVMTGGRERNEMEYRMLFNAAGFRLTKIIPTESFVSIVEGVKTSNR